MCWSGMDFHHVQSDCMCLSCKNCETLNNCVLTILSLIFFDSFNCWIVGYSNIINDFNVQFDYLLFWMAIVYVVCASAAVSVSRNNYGAYASEGEGVCKKLTLADG